MNLYNFQEIHFHNDEFIARTRYTCDTLETAVNLARRWYIGPGPKNVGVRVVLFVPGEHGIYENREAGGCLYLRWHESRLIQYADVQFEPSEEGL